MASPDIGPDTSSLPSACGGCQFQTVREIFLNWWIKGRKSAVTVSPVLMLQPSGPICCNAELEFLKLQQAERWEGKRLQQHLCGQSRTCHLPGIYSRHRRPPTWLRSRQSNVLLILILPQTSLKCLDQKIMLTCHLHLARCLYQKTTTTTKKHLHFTIRHSLAPLPVCLHGLRSQT